MIDSETTEEVGSYYVDATIQVRLLVKARSENHAFELADEILNNDFMKIPEVQQINEVDIFNVED